MTPAPAAAPKLLEWVRADDGWTLKLLGDWRGRPVKGGALVALMPRPRPKPKAAPEPEARPGSGDTLRIDASGLQHYDADTAPRLWALLAPLRREGVRLDFAALPEALRSPLELALPAAGGGADEVPAEQAAPGLVQMLRERWRQALNTASFIGEVVLALGRLLRGRTTMRGADLLRQIDVAGPMSLPIVSLTCFLIGLMLAYMGGAQLQRIGAQTFIADVVAVGVVRELASLMTGVILAGRIGAAYAAQIGSMQANEEIDALRALGIDPIEYLVLPRLLALLAVAPLLIAYAALVGVLAGLPPVVGIYGVPAREYLNQCLAALNATHVTIGLFKGTMYIGLVALAGCREGLYAGRDAQAVGAATTTAVVKALLWIVIAASASTVLFQSLGL